MQDCTEHLRWLARTLGEARDWDVMLDQTLREIRDALPGEAGLHQLLERSAVLRHRARISARDALRSRRYTATLLGLLGFFLRAPWLLSQDDGAAARERPLMDFAAEVLHDRHRKVVKHADALRVLDAEQMHALRIRVKKLRYAAEFFGSLYAKKAVREYVAALSGLQSLLGTLNDAATAERLTQTMRGDRDMPLEGAGLLRGWCAARAQADRKKLSKAWSKFEACESFW
jgi:CHAD domain-containing protein